jgi:hypothetical protein
MGLPALLVPACVILVPALTLVALESALVVACWLVSSRGVTGLPAVVARSSGSLIYR